MKHKLFNKAIYISSLKRFWVGSALYFILLLLLSYFWNAYPGMDDYHGVFFPYIDYFNEQFTLSILLSMFVAVVVSSLLFRFVHSKKQSVFLHSAPVTRLEVYITTLLAAFTLMGIPVILTGFVISVATGEFVWGFMWIGYTLFALMSYFSVAVFSAMLTGTTYITYVLYFAFLYISSFIKSFIDCVMEIFAAGYWGSGNSILFNAFSVTENLNNLIYAESSGFVWKGAEATVILVVHWVVLYLLGYLLYKKRNLEKCEDAATYKWFYYVLKYAATAAGVMIVFSYYEEISLPWAVWSIVISFIVYFGTEMILRKEIKVWDAYKGYVVFLIGYTLFLLFMAKTTIFGYETYQPKIDEIDKMMVMTNFGTGGNFTDYESIEKMYNHHKRVIESERSENLSEVSLQVGYETKGKWVYREYYIARKMRDEIMNSMYESEIFKRETEDVFNFIQGDDVVSFSISDGNKNVAAHVVNNAEELFNCVRRDVLQNSYTELYGGEYTYHITFWHYKELKHFMTQSHDAPEGYYQDSYTVHINENYTETCKWMKENGYM